MEAHGLASADARALDIASVGGACCGAHDWGGLASCWRTVGKSGYGAAAGPPRARASSSLFLTPSSLVELEGPSFADSFPYPSSFSAARTSQLPHFVTPAPLGTASDYLDATPKHALRPSSGTVRARRRKGRVQVRLQRTYRSL